VYSTEPADRGHNIPGRGRLERYPVNAQVRAGVPQRNPPPLPADVQRYIVMDGRSAHCTPEIRHRAVHKHIGFCPWPAPQPHRPPLVTLPRTRHQRLRVPRTGLPSPKPPKLYPPRQPRSPRRLIRDSTRPREPATGRPPKSPAERRVLAQQGWCRARERLSRRAVGQPVSPSLGVLPARQSPRAATVWR
jgi:hypothetical protein